MRASDEYVAPLIASTFIFAAVSGSFPMYADSSLFALENIPGDSLLGNVSILVILFLLMYIFSGVVPPYPLTFAAMDVVLTTVVPFFLLIAPLCCVAAVRQTADARHISMAAAVLTVLFILLRFSCVIACRFRSECYVLGSV